MRKTLFILLLFITVISHAQWVQIPNGMGGNVYVFSLAYCGNNIFAGTGTPPNPQGIYLSTNNGTNWTKAGLNNENVFSLAVNGNNVFAGCAHGNGVYRTTNNGISWIQTLNGQYVNSLAANGNNIFAGTIYNGVYSSTNNGTNWSQTSLNYRTVYSLAINGNNIFAGTDTPNRFFVSNNNGANWTQRNEGLPDSKVHSLCILNNYIFAGTFAYGTTGNGVYRRLLGELVGIKPISNEVPENFSLSQNFPNPFNPVTNVKFQIQNEAFVKLIVFDVLGREISTLVNEQLQPGTYEVDWDASQYSSGIYFYKLTSEDFSDTKKMVLIK